MYLILYIFLLTSRFVLTLLPQKGYIHPDEHFQYPEIVYGDLLHIHSFRTWEFTCTEPIRSIAFPYAIVGLPSAILSLIEGSSVYQTSFSYLLLVLPRLVMCCISVVHDACLIKICKLTKENCLYRLVIFASSYVTLTFSTRTLSNSLEALFFTLLIYLVCKDLCGKTLNHKKRNTSKNYVSRDYLVGVLVAAGFFVRPTFLLFAFAPVMFWIKSTGRLSSNIISCARNIMWCLPGALTTAVGLIVIDTVYYNDNYFGDVSSSMFDVLERPVVTPVNFIQYNLDLTRVRSHGDHPVYLHFLVNLHMLFPVLGIFGLLYFFRLLRSIRQKEWKWDSIEGLMFTSFILPVALLSIIPHQEPRFITPVLFPLVYLCAKDILSCDKYKVYTILWFLGNVVGTVFFGFVHQGGLSSALASLSVQISKQDIESDMTDIVFYHTYMPPRYLMAISSLRNNIQIHDLSGSKEEILFSKLYDVIHSSVPSSNVFIVSPGTLHSSFIKLNHSLSPSVKITMNRTFFPHFSSEDPPNFNEIFEHLGNNYSIKIQEVMELFSLNLYKAELI